MEAKSQRPKGREGAISALNAAIEALNLANELSTIAPAKTVFGSINTLLTLIRVCSCSPATIFSRLTPNKDLTVDGLDYVELGLFCVDICRVLDRGMNGKKMDDLSQPVYDAINGLTA